MKQGRKTGKNRWWGGLLASVLAGLILALLLSPPAPGQQFLQYGFESRDPVWTLGRHEAVGFNEIAHRLVGVDAGEDGSVHSGQRSEFLFFQVQSGTVIHYTYSIGRARVDEDLTAGVWLRGNRPGMKLLARAVLPRERDPQHPDQPLTLLLPGTVYKTVGRWQPLTLPLPTRLLNQQVQLLRTSLKRDVSAADAYIDQLVLDVYTGPGDTKVWIDDLEVGPILPGSEARPTTPAGSAIPAQPASRIRSAVQVSKKQLWVDGQRRFLFAIRHTGMPLSALRRVGFNTVWLDESTPDGLIEEASMLGFMIIPSMRLPTMPFTPGGPVQGQLTSSGEAPGQKVSRFLEQPGVLCVDLGSNLSAEQVPTILQSAQMFRRLDSSRPVAVDVCDGFNYYCRTLSQPMIGIHRWPLLTTLELTAYRDWLVQRRLLADPDAYCWTWVQTHWPDWFTTAAYQRSAATRFEEPIGPHPEQIRLLSYIAVGSGFRGLSYWSDRFLADSHVGRDRLLALAVLSQEFQMLEPLLVSVSDEPQWIECDNNPFIKVAILRCDGAVLALPIWMGPGSQIVPPQGSTASVKFTVPLAPNSSVAWEVSPGRLRSYPLTPRQGGMQVELRDFSLTSAVVLTSDLTRSGLIVRFQNMQRKLQSDASQYLLDQAEEELKKALPIDEELRQLNHPIEDSEQIISRAKEELQKGRDHRRNHEYPEAYTSAQVVLRGIRVLMRAHWENAMRGLNTPVMTPYLLSYYTLPRHWRFVDEVLRLEAGKNVLPEGDFETPPTQSQDNWYLQTVKSPDPVEMTARRVTPEVLPKNGGKQALLLEIKQKYSQLPPPVALERTYMAIHSPAVHLPPGTLVRIRVWVRIPALILGSADGAMIYDSAGGEPMAIRLREPTKPEGELYSVFRRVPESGRINVVLGLSGIGKAYFDNVLIEPMVARDPSKPMPAETQPKNLAIPVSRRR